MSQTIEFFGVNKIYRLGQEEVHALQDIHLSIGKGEFVAITGPSGSGKTTLAQVMGGLTAATSGAIKIEGQPVSDFSDRQLSKFRNRHVGFVFQNFALLPHYSALENVMIPLLVAGLGRPERIQKARHYLSLVDLSNKAHHLSKTLSGGQRQRVAIARALAMEPRIIIADEPTGNLDSTNGAQVIDALQQLANTGVTVVMVTHDQALAKRAHRRIHLKDGKVIHAHA